MGNCAVATSILACCLCSACYTINLAIRANNYPHCTHYIPRFWWVYQWNNNNLACPRVRYPSILRIFCFLQFRFLFRYPQCQTDPMENNNCQSLITCMLKQDWYSPTNDGNQSLAMQSLSKLQVRVAAFGWNSHATCVNFPKWLSSTETPSHSRSYWWSPWVLLMNQLFFQG